MTPSQTRKRRGQILIALILFLLAVVGVLALTLDFGFVLLSRRTMQTAVNIGALEGGRDIESEGRQSARRTMRNVFDDDMDPTENLTTLGAGPDHSLVTRNSNDWTQLGSGTSGRDLFSNRHQYIFRPNPELNSGNRPHGDFVTGRYLDPDSDGFSHLETSDYQRRDFVADDSGNAFLARLRRTPQRAGVANPLDRETGTSSSGSGSPLLLGRLMPFIHGPSSTFDVRRDGVTVRATAIADGKPILSVGRAIEKYFGIGGSEITPYYYSVPYGFLPEDSNWYQLSERQFSIGQRCELVDFDPSDSELDPIPEDEIPDSEFVGYAPVIWEDQGTHYVVGFRLRSRNKQGSQVERNPNGSPRMHDAAAALNALAPDVRSAVFSRFRELSDEQDSILARVPALVRSIR